MTQRAWLDLAVALARLRAQLVRHADGARGAMMKRAHLERILGVDLAARAICKTLRARSTRFDARRFLKIVRS